MVQLHKDDIVKLCASVYDFCGASGTYAYYVGDINLSKDTCSIVVDTPKHPCPVKDGCCLDLSGVELEFQWMNIVSDDDINNCTDSTKLRVLGSGNSDSDGVVTIQHTIDQNDLDLYNSNTNFDLRVCIRNKTAAEVVKFGEARSKLTIHKDDKISIIGPVVPTHSVVLNMSYVPVELMNLFSTYITDISNGLMSELNLISPLPSPWMYLKTDYKRVDNSFNMLFYLPPASAVGGRFGGRFKYLGWIDDQVNNLINWIKGVLDFWLPIVLGILAVIAALSGAWYIAFILSAAALISKWRLDDLNARQTKSEEVIKNLGAINQGNKKEDDGRKKVEDTFSSSSKTSDDCLKRLENHRDVHIAKIDGLNTNFSKYANLVGELNTEKTSFTRVANGIIADFKKQTYTATVCDTYYIKMDNAIRDSDITITSKTDTYVDPTGQFETKCTGWTSKKDCEIAKCYWYDNKCNESAECFIENPSGGCIISKKTAKTIAIASIVVGGLYGGIKLYKYMSKPTTTVIYKSPGGG